MKVLIFLVPKILLLFWLEKEQEKRREKVLLGILTETGGIFVWISSFVWEFIRKFGLLQSPKFPFFSWEFQKAVDMPVMRGSCTKEEEQHNVSSIRYSWYV